MNQEKVFYISYYEKGNIIIKQEEFILEEKQDFTPSLKLVEKLFLEKKNNRNIIVISIDTEKINGETINQLKLNGEIRNTFRRTE